MAQGRLDRDQFFEKLAEMEATDLIRSAARLTPPSAQNAICEHWDYLRTDTSFHSVLWLIEWSRSQVHPTFLAPPILTPASTGA